MRCMRRCLGVVWFSTALGCATYAERTELARDALARGDLAGSEAQFNALLRVRKSEQLPHKFKKNDALIILERGSVLQAQRRYPLSARDFELADKELELLDIARDTAGKIGKYIYSDSAPKYKASPTEKLSLNAMNMCNYLVRGDLSGAAVEARRFTTMRKYLHDYDKTRAYGAFGSYLAGFTFEYLGRTDEALRYYDEALSDGVLPSLQTPLRRLLANGASGTSRVRETAGLSDGEPVATLSDAGGEILILAKLGRVPHKEPMRIPIGAAIGIAGAFVMGDTTILQYGMFKVVVYPELVATTNAFDRFDYAIDGKPGEADLVTDLAREIRREYEAIKPKIIGAALTRMIARAVAAEGARAAGRQAQGAGGLVGFLAAAALEGTLVALDRPDTRSWSSLPAQLYIARVRVPAGTHKVSLRASGPGGALTREVSVDVAAGQFTVLDLTTLR